jgi:hypothetical protein
VIVDQHHCSSRANFPSPTVIVQTSTKLQQTSTKLQLHQHCSPRWGECGTPRRPHPVSLVKRAFGWFPRGTCKNDVLCVNLVRPLVICGVAHGRGALTSYALCGVHPLQVKELFLCVHGLKTENRSAVIEAGAHSLN